MVITLHIELATCWRWSSVFLKLGPSFVLSYLIM